MDVERGMNNETAKWGNALPWWLPLLTSVTVDRLADWWWLSRVGRIVEQCSPSYTIHTYTKHIYVVTFTHCISLAKQPMRCNWRKKIHNLQWPWPHLAASPRYTITILFGKLWTIFEKSWIFGKLWIKTVNISEIVNISNSWTLLPISIHFLKSWTVF